MRVKNARLGILSIISGAVVIVGAAIFNIIVGKSILRTLVLYISGINFLLIGIANLIGIRVVSDRNGEALKYRKYGNLIFWGVMGVTAFIIWQAIKVKLL